MSILTYITDRTNRIKTGAAAAVALILTSGAAGSYLLWGQNLAGVTTAKLDPNGNLTVSGSMNVGSGSKSVQLHNNGDVRAQGTLSGNKLYTGSMSGAGLTDCDAATDTLNWDATAGRFSCGTDATGGAGSAPEVGTAAFSGAVVQLGNTQFVKKSGDTMTGALNVRAALSGSSLFTLSGYRTCTMKTTSTGAVYCGVDNNTSQNLFETIAVSGQSDVVADTTTDTLTLAAGSNITLTTNATTDTITVAATDTNTTYTAGEGLSLVGTRFQMKAAMTGSSLKVTGTLSGALLVISNMRNCTLKTSSSGNTICGTDIDTNTDLFNTGSILSTTEGRYVNIRGDTMTGALNIDLTSGFRGLNIVETASGAHIHAEKGLSTSGSLSIEGTASGAAIRGFGLLTDCDTAGTSKLLWDSTLGRFSCGTDTDTNTTYTAGEGLSLVGTRFQMKAAMTGSSLKVTGTLSGARLVISNMRNCTLKTSSTGNTICGTDLNSDLFSTGSILGAGDRKYVNLGGDSMTGTLTIAPSSGVALNARGTISGALLVVSSNSNFSDANITFSTTGSVVFNEDSRPVDFRIEGDTSSALFYLDASTDRIGVNKSDPRTTLDVNGTISGSLLEGTTLSGTIIRSQYAISPTCIPFAIAGTGTALTTGSGKFRLPIPYTLSGFQLGIVKIFTDSSGVGGTTGLQIRDASKGFRKLLSTVVSIDGSESGSTTAATPYVVSTANDDVGGDDALYFDVTSIHSTRAAKGLSGYTCWYRP